MHCEASTHYHMIVLRSALGARENARRFGLRTSAAFDERLERACEFALACHRPDGEIAMLSDSDAGSYPDLLERAASLLERPDFLYAASRGERGTAPARRSTRASPTAATTSSAAAGGSAGGRSRTSST